LKYKKQKGLIAAVHTPLNNDLSINYNYIEKQAKHLLKHNISGVYVGGTTGEGLLFSNKERSELFKAWGEITKYNRLIFFANISHKNQSSSSKLAIEAQNSGADFISSLCLDPNVNSPKDLVKWLKPILNTTPDIPYYYYESPKFSGKKINMEDFLIITNKELKSLVGLKYNNSNLETSFSSKTTPDIFELFEIISSVEWSDESLNICIEVSSHALDQKRLKGINWFNSSSLMNIKDDHLDYHKDISSYRDAKFNIFKTNSPVKLIHENISDFSRDYEFINNSDSQPISISNKNNFADIYFKIKTISINSSEFYILINNPPHTQEHEKGKKYHFKCNLFPEFNITNLVFTICSIGFDNFSEHTVNDLSFLNLPKGRTEFIKDIPDNIVIDYAHNEDAIKFFLKSLSNYFDNLVVVFGCGGNRDKNKRSKMLRSAIENSTNVIFTSDNLRNETFEDIFIDAKGDNKLDSVIAIEDRREAIIQGTKMIKNNDCLVVLGKGHENFQETNSNFIKFSDHEVINEIYS